MTLNKERIYGYAKAYLNAQITFLRYEIKEEENDYEMANACLLQMSLNQYEDDLSELEKIMEVADNE